MSVISGLCDRVVVLSYGKVLAAGSFAEVTDDPSVLAAYLGTEDEDVGGRF